MKLSHALPRPLPQQPPLCPSHSPPLLPPAQVNCQRPPTNSPHFPPGYPPSFSHPHPPLHGFPRKTRGVSSPFARGPSPHSPKNQAHFGSVLRKTLNPSTPPSSPSPFFAQQQPLMGMRTQAAAGGSSGEASETSAEPEVAVFAPERHMPPPPPGWAAKKREQRELEIKKLDGIRIRRRPPSGPNSHYVGAFEFIIEDDDNHPINILEEIVWNKDAELQRMKDKMPLSAVMQALSAADVAPARDFVGALRARAEETGVPALIAEVKKASPSRGVIQLDFDPVRIARAYEQGGAACLSVLTDSKYFQGSFENLRLIRQAGVQCPVLCKEFIVDAWQLYYARLHGADAVLLIAAVLPDRDLQYMLKIIHSLRMEALVEVHSEEEMERVLGLAGVQLIGINNRDLGTFEVDIGNTEMLLAGEHGRQIRDRGILVVGESGLVTPQDIERVQAAGCSAVLVGESIVKQSDPAAGIAGLFGKDISRPTPTDHLPGSLAEVVPEVVV